MTKTFSFPTSADITAWAGSTGRLPNPPSFDAVAHRVSRGGWLFTTSVLMPTLVGLAIGLSLQRVVGQLSDRDYWVMFGTLAILVVATSLQWRTIVGWFRPDVAIAYYASACIDHLRRFDGLPEDCAVYLRIVLPELERQLLSPRLTVRGAGTTAARRVVATNQAALALTIGNAEEAWRRRPCRTETDGLVEALGCSLAVVVLDHWFGGGIARPENRQAATDPAASGTSPLSWLGRLGTSLVSKGTDLAIGSLGSLLLLLLAGAQRT